jgi:hypothetical protein
MRFFSQLGVILLAALGEVSKINGLCAGMDRVNLENRERSQLRAIAVGEEHVRAHITVNCILDIYQFLNLPEGSARVKLFIENKNHPTWQKFCKDHAAKFVCDTWDVSGEFENVVNKVRYFYLHAAIQAIYKIYLAEGALDQYLHHGAAKEKELIAKAVKLIDLSHSAPKDEWDDIVSGAIQSIKAGITAGLNFDRIFAQLHARVIELDAKPGSFGSCYATWYSVEATMLDSIRPHNNARDVSYQDKFKRQEDLNSRNNGYSIFQSGSNHVYRLLDDTPDAAVAMMTYESLAF